MHRSRGTGIHPNADGSGRCGPLVKVERIGHADYGGYDNNSTHRGPGITGASGTHGGASQPNSAASCADQYGHSNSDGNADTAACANRNADSRACARH
jgi:hypothetical protein